MVPEKGIQIIKGNYLKCQDFQLHLCSYASFNYMTHESIIEAISNGDGPTSYNFAYCIACLLTPMNDCLYFPLFCN